MSQTSKESVKQKIDSSQCKVCGAPASYVFFGALSCETCKVFFRRNAKNQTKLTKCRYDGQCEITVYNRHICASCRLSKCFQVGMEIERIRGAIGLRKTKPKSTQCNQITKFPTINLLDKDNSTLNENQWILLSNLIHNYDEKQLLLMSDQLQNANRLLKAEGMINEALARDLMRSFYDIAGICLRSNNHISHLSIDDRSVLLHTAAENVTCLSGLFIFSHSHLLNDQLLWNYLEAVYGQRTMRYQRYSAEFTQLDPILFKLSMNLFALSTNSRSFHENISFEYQNLNDILNIENIYVELTWKYLVYKYGYHQSIRTFLNITQWFLCVTTFIFFTHESPRHVDDIELLIQQTETSLAIDDIDKITQNN